MKKVMKETKESESSASDGDAGICGGSHKE